MDEAAERAIAAWGPLARAWNRAGLPGYSQNERCQLGTGGAGRDHIIYGSGATWLDAARDAGLL